MFLACHFLEGTHAVHCIALGAPDPMERPDGHLAPGASAGSSAPQPKANARGQRSGLCCVHPLSGDDVLHQLQRHRDHQVPRTAQSGAARITSEASEPKVTKAAPWAAWPGGESPGSESVQSSWFAGTDSVVGLPAPVSPTTCIDIRPLQAGAVAWRKALLPRPPAPERR